MAGIKHSGNRPKTGKNLRSGTVKKFRNDSPEARTVYMAKMASRASRKLKKNKKRK